jgi:hypothetical protein
MVPHAAYITSEAVPKWQDQDGGFGALQPPDRDYAGFCIVCVAF